MLAASAVPALVLNADYWPLRYAPASCWSWRAAIEAVVQGRVEVVAQYERTVRSPSTELRLPPVVALRQFVDLARPAPLTARPKPA